MALTFIILLPLVTITHFVEKCHSTDCTWKGQNVPEGCKICLKSLYTRNYQECKPDGQWNFGRKCGESKQGAWRCAQTRWCERFCYIEGSYCFEGQGPYSEQFPHKCERCEETGVKENWRICSLQGQWIERHCKDKEHPDMKCFQSTNDTCAKMCRNN